MASFDFKDQFSGIYQGKTVLITGHTGFKGSWLSCWLSYLGATVIGYSKDVPTVPSHFALLPVPEHAHFYESDIRDLTSLERVMHTHRPDIVFHLAAQSLVRPSYAHPLETFATNIMGTANVLECCRKTDSVRAVVNVTSDKCYENNDLDRPFRETDRMGGFDPYSCSKGASELLTSCFRNSFYQHEQKLLAGARAGNVIGGGDWAVDRLIPDLVKATSRAETTLIRYPHATRPWQHVLEPLSGYLLLGQKLLEGEADFADGWNFGPKDQEALTVLEVLGIFKEHWPDMEFEYDKDENKPYEAGFLSLDCSKARQRLHWQPVWNSAGAIARTVAWYRRYYEEKRIATLDNLLEYSKEAQRLGYAWAAPVNKHEVYANPS